MSEILLTTQNSENKNYQKPRNRSALPLQSCGQWGLGMLFVAIPYALLHTLVPDGSLEDFILFTAKLFCAALFLSTVLASLRISEKRRICALSSALIYAEIAASLFIGARLFTLTLAMILVLDIDHVSTPKTWEAWLAMIP